MLPTFSTFDPGAYPEALDAILEQNEVQLEALLKGKKPFTWDNLMYPLESLSDTLERSFSILSHLNAVMDTPALRDAYSSCLPKLSAYESKLHHNYELFKAIQSIDKNTLSKTQQKVVTDALEDFELSGIALPKAEQERFEAINTKLSELSHQFEIHILDAVAAYQLHITDESELDGLPEYAMANASALATKSGKTGFILGIDAPTYIAVSTYATSRKLRETLYEAFVTRASDAGPHAGQFDNSKLIDEILALRAEKAELLNFNAYTELSLATKMAKDSKEVFEFINTLVDHVLPQAKEDVQALKAFAKSELNLSDLKPWDVSFVSQKRKEALLQLNDEALRVYFPLPKVLDGAFHITNTLYGIHFEDITASVDTWHPDVICYAVYNKDKACIGYIYMDLFARPNKRQGAWMSEAQSRRKLKDGTIQLPIAFLSCNFAHAKKYVSPTLSHSEVTTIFHELGHCLHHVLTAVDELSASGISGVEWDAVELPSQFFENFCWDEKALRYMSGHVETDEPLPKHLFDALIASRQFQSGLHLIRQLEFAWFDFLLHDAYPTDAPENWLSTALNTVRETTQVLPTAHYNRLAHSFSHLFAGGYAAGYYSYLWAEVLSSDAFSRFEEEGILNPQTGQDFLSNILQVGSTKKAADFFKAFRGRAPEVNALLRHHGIKT